MTTLYRSTLLRADGAGRTVYGLAVPYGQVTTVSDGMGRDYQESFIEGSFARSIRERGDKVKLLIAHDSRRLPIGRAVDLHEAADGLHASFLVSDTRDGQEALTLVRDGAVDAFSVGFRPVKERQERGVTVRTEAALYEVSLTGLPAYPGAAIAGVRTAHPILSADLARMRLDIILNSW